LSRYRFRHILFQNYLYSSLDGVERAHLHEAVGNVLEAIYADETQEIAVPLARHYQEAGIAGKATAYLLQAGERAIRRSADREAITHLSQGSELLKTLPESTERDRLELKLQLALGVPLLLTRGHAAPEVGRTYSRVQQLSTRVGDDAQLFDALLGRRRFEFARGEMHKGKQLGEQLLALAQRAQDPSDGHRLRLLCRAHMMQAEALFWVGEFTEAWEHCRQGLTACSPEQRRTDVFLYGNDTGVGLRTYEVLTLWHLGYPDQALTRAHETLTLAQELSHPFTLVIASSFSAILFQLCRMAREVQTAVEQVLCISRDHGFVLCEAAGKILRGWALAEEGQATEGIEQMREGILSWVSLGAKAWRPTYCSYLIGAYQKAGYVDEGLEQLTKTITALQGTGERAYEAELHRLEGELCLMTGGTAAEAEASFKRALHVARAQHARSWELRAATSLSRLWHQQSKTENARNLLQGVYDWFSEGFDTADLKDARALLERFS
jgi:predicted ATPase